MLFRSGGDRIAPRADMRRGHKAEQGIIPRRRLAPARGHVRGGLAGDCAGGACGHALAVSMGRGV